MLDRNRKFADSPLEGAGFELTVPRETWSAVLSLHPSATRGAAAPSLDARYCGAGSGQHWSASHRIQRPAHLTIATLPVSPPITDTLRCGFTQSVSEPHGWR